MALPLDTQLGEKLPSSRAAPGPWLQGQHCQNWRLVTKILFRTQTHWGKDEAQTEPSRASCSGPMPGLHFTAGMGEWEEAWHTGGVVASINLRRWCCCDRRNMKP